MDFVNAVVPAVTDRHRKLHLLSLDLTGNQARLSGEDVVERCHAVRTTRTDEYAEIFRVAVSGAHQPEEDLCFEKDVLILSRRVATGQKSKNVDHTWPAITLVFEGRRYG